MNSLTIWKSLIFVVLVAGGIVAGVYLSSGQPDRVSEEPKVLAKDDNRIPLIEHRFPLSSLDMKDTVEAPDLAVDADNQVYLTWGSKTSATERSVLYTRSVDGGTTFEPVRTISRGGIYKSQAKEGGKAVGYERRTSPHLAVSGGKLYLSWSEARKDASAMRLLVATSDDQGVGFGKPVEVPQTKRANPTFTALTAGPGTALATAWLDDRNGVQLPYAAQFDPTQGAFLPEMRLATGAADQGVCPCCSTGACYAADGTLYVAYRNIQEGYRDIAIGRLRPGQTQFDGPFPVVPTTWKFNGCPHDGPSLTVIGDTLHILWMDARSGSQRCYYATAKTSTMTFETRELDPNSPGTQGNARLFADSMGGIHAVWEQSIGTDISGEGTPAHHAPKLSAATGRAIYYSYLPKGSTKFPAGRAIAAKSGAFQTRPAIAMTPAGRIVVAWNELETTGKSVVLVSLPAPTGGN